MSDDIDAAVVHPSPVWADRADTVVLADIRARQFPSSYEPLPARLLGPDTYEICCVPFFAYDLALGDLVRATHRRRVTLPVVNDVVEWSGRQVFRVWFGAKSDPLTRLEVRDAAPEWGGLVEVHSENLLAIDADTPDVARRIADRLDAFAATDRLDWETGHTDA